MVSVTMAFSAERVPPSVSVPNGSSLISNFTLPKSTRVLLSFSCRGDVGVDSSPEQLAASNAVLAASQSVKRSFSTCRDCFVHNLHNFEWIITVIFSFAQWTKETKTACKDIPKNTLASCYFYYISCNLLTYARVCTSLNIYIACVLAKSPKQTNIKP